jgi:hypothetical protein
VIFFPFPLANAVVVTKTAKAAAFVVAAAVVGVGRLVAAVVEIVVDGNATSAYFASVGPDTSVRPSTLAQCASGRAFWDE